VTQDKALQSATGIFTALPEAMVDRGADVLERLGAELDKVSFFAVIPPDRNTPCTLTTHYVEH
jgi:hypothetical protein